jgi:hypothetical protein
MNAAIPVSFLGKKKFVIADILVLTKELMNKETLVFYIKKNLMKVSLFPTKKLCML